MTKPFIWLPTVLALMACGGEDPMPQGEPVARPLAGRSMLTPKPWAQLAPGVWERVREDGIRERSSTGVEGLEYELQLARTERALIAQVFKANGNVSALKASPQESDQRIQFLENALAEEKNSVRVRTPNERLSAQGFYEEGSSSGPFCGGTYGFDAQFFIEMTGGSVSMQGYFLEPSPYSPYTKRIYVRAAAWMYDPDIVNYDAEWSPTFSNTCCFSTNQVYAGIDPTFSPVLEAYGYIKSDGCGSIIYTARTY
ncbi:hypothetical protein [Archangium violaceum]|uniref:Lipoprotein n=1 Tax=Archangium violaceum Cb vi76 TaxID=1406225 RepID=A0A084SGI1_9BACT|nr:hypothetical protein [Archangium violaceum]KFA87566.1 hypothetical protein Q664_46955 [Archangium violaceum Cb vi76]